MTSGDTHYLFKGYQGTSTEVIRVEFRQSSGNYEIRAGLIDNGTSWSYTSWFTLSDASHSIEWDWRAASAGGLTLWIDGTQQADVTDINNVDRRMDRARLGPLSGLDAGTSGTYYFDSFESRRANYIGPMTMGGSNLALGGNAGRVDGALPSYRDQSAVEANRNQSHYVSYQLAPAQQSGNTFTAVADAYVAGDATTTNYGTSTTLRADNSPDLNSYLRFDVQGLTGSVTSATLRIYANSASSTGYTLHSVSDNTWTETGITYSNAPAMGSQLGASGAITAGTWTTVDVTSYITGNGSYNLAFTTTSSTNTSFSSREGANPPELIIVTSGGATNTPTATNTPGPSPTPTRTSTPGASNTPTITPTAPPSFSSAAFVYDGDGKRVKSAFNGTITTYFVGAHYEVTGSTVTKYYYAGAQRIAMRSNGALNYLLGDHLGSTSLVTDSAGNKINEQRYKAWGETRYTFGNPTTRYQYTGQFSYEAEFGLYFYNARWVDVSLGRFAQADSIIPGGVQGYDRYAYTNNNPVRYTDPSGHIACDDNSNGECNPYTQADKINDLKSILKDRYNWNVGGEEWTLKELDTIYQTGRDIETYVDKLTGGRGQEWMNEYLGGVSIFHGGDDRTSSSWPWKHIYLGETWLSGYTGGDSWTPKQLFAHELGHAWDMSSGNYLGIGGGVGDDLMWAVWGDPTKSFRIFRYKSGDPAIPLGDARWRSSVNYGYGNGSVNDYAAESFSWSIYIVDKEI